MTDEDKLKRKCGKWLKENPDENRWHYAATDKYYSGIPDFIFCIQGLFVSIELKTPKGVVSKIQNWTLDQIVRAGGKGLVIRSFEEFVITVKALQQ